MKSLFAPLLFISTATAQVEWHGWMSSGRDVHFALSENGGKTRWVRIADTIGGFRVERFDAEPEILTLGRDGETRLIRISGRLSREGEPAASEILLRAEAAAESSTAVADALASYRTHTDLITKLRERMIENPASNRFTVRYLADALEDQSDALAKLTTLLGQTHK